MGFLSNIEVLQVIQEHTQDRTNLDKKKKKKNKKTDCPNLIEIEDKVRDYIKSNCEFPSGDLSEFLKELSKFRLSIQQKLQIINLTPRSLVEIHIIQGIENLSEEDIEEILVLVEKFFKK